jgi:hypothetical protein
MSQISILEFTSAMYLKLKMVTISDVKCRVHLVYKLYLHSTITIKLAISIQYFHSLKLVRTVSVIARFFWRNPQDALGISISKSKNF